MQERLPRHWKLEQRMEHDYTDVGVRVAPGAATELPDEQERPDNLLHFLRPWRSDTISIRIVGRLQGLAVAACPRP